jgi:SAM-dependent methyltransferase
MSQIESGVRRLLALPAAYDGFQALMGAPAARLRWIRECIRPFPRARILDIGCGTAELLSLLPADADYTGFDMSPAYIEAARRRYGGRGRFLCAKADAFVPEDGFDIAMAFGVLHHLDDAESRKVFAGARKALKPSGRMVTLDGTFTESQSALSRFAVSRDRGRNVRSPEGYASLARDAFAHVEVSVWDDALRIPYHHAILVCRP